MKARWGGRLLALSIMLASSGCSLIPGLGAPDAAAQFESITAAAGGNQVWRLELNYFPTQNEWGIWAAVGPQAKAWETYSGEAAESDTSYSIVTDRPKTMTSDDIREILAATKEQITPDCAPTYHLLILPSGREASWLMCNGNQRVPGSSRLDGQPVPDSFDPTDATQLQAALDLTGQVFADGKIIELSDTRRPGTSLWAIGALVQPPGHELCYPWFSPSGSGDSLLQLGCNEPSIFASNPQPFDPTRYDVNAMLSIRAAAAAHYGMSPDDFFNVTYTSQDGNLLDVRLTSWSQVATTTLGPSR